MTKISLAPISILVGMAGVSQAQAGLPAAFCSASRLSRAAANSHGGALDGANGAAARDFGDLLVSCDFADALRPLRLERRSGPSRRHPPDRRPHGRQHRGRRRRFGCLPVARAKARAAAASSRTLPKTGLLKRLQAN